MELIKPGTRINFMKQLRFWVTVSVVLALGSLVLTLMPPGKFVEVGGVKIGLGPNYGTDFRGGTTPAATDKVEPKPADAAAAAPAASPAAATPKPSPPASDAA